MLEGVFYNLCVYVAKCISVKIHRIRICSTFHFYNGTVQLLQNAQFMMDKLINMLFINIFINNLAF